MKNIHLIPTDKYSSLVYSTSKYGGLFLSKHYSPMQVMGDSYQNIYITSGDEIKDGDCIINLETNRISKADFRKDILKSYIAKHFKKIILTTDQDLIKDGVQAIDDTFLEWFVKNPSCEEVEVKKVIGRYVDYGGNVHSPINYKIIIPKEEQKQEPIEELDYNKIIEQSLVELRKQPMSFVPDKRMYSEEEVLDIINSFEKLCYTYQSNKDWFPAKKSEWFEKFKKK
jgi:hypothetical protein